MAKIAILGYGKMGKEVEKILLSRQEEIVARIDNEDDWQQQWNQFLTADVAIEFSMPSVAVENFKKCFENHIPLVAGTTGWYDRMDEVLNYCRQCGSSFIFGSNFSIGVNIFFKINELLAGIMKNQAAFEVKIEETHHVTKKDAPSGTAIHLAQIIENQYDEPKKVPIDSYRLPDVPGIHKVTYQSENEIIELTHTAKNRVELAQGAVKAALWLLQHPGIYDFKEIALRINNY
ncbi:MAG: 4-hydroxy-tetrahydrodipicolinate reductase [Bacteroidales bacterium]|nr:4-hydroxy-tetrahydrodipicolinate reductase [Bacteroidales bacterium]